MMSDRKAQILQLAAELVSTVGFEGFSYHDISNRLNVTNASIHYHFPKKEDLGVALCNEMIQHKRQMRDSILKNYDSPWQQLNQYFEMFRGLCNTSECQQICPISALQAEINLLPSSIRKKVVELDQVEVDFLAAILENGKQSGEMRYVGSALQFAMMLISATKGALQFSRVHGGEYYENTVKQLTSMLEV